MRYRKRDYYGRGRKRKHIVVAAGIIIVFALSIVLGLMKACGIGFFGRAEQLSQEEIEERKPDIDVQLLAVNEYSRPGTEVEKIRGIVIHYTANPGSTAMDNRNYFEGLKDSHETKASSNFVVGLEGEIVQCVPTWEVAYASNSRNIDTVSIECCHPDETGRFNDATYQSMVKLCAWLCMKFDLTSEDVIRHYDVTGKNCPKYFVENEDAFAAFRDDITQAIENTPSE